MTKSIKPDDKKSGKQIQIEQKVSQMSDDSRVVGAVINLTYQGRTIAVPGLDSVKLTCSAIANEYFEYPGVDIHIESTARRLPLSATPYDEFGPSGPPEDLVRLISETSRVIVLGEPGSGKTVALLRTAWEAANQDPPTLPIFVPLLEYAGQDLLEFIRRKLSQISKPLHFEDTVDLEAFLVNGSVKCHFLVDGLNEVQPQHRERIQAELSTFPYGKHFVTITSRVQDETWRRLRASSSTFSKTVIVQPIGKNQIYPYLRSFVAEERLTEIWRKLKNDERLLELLRTPLLLWLAKESILYEGALPSNRGELYYNFVNYMLRRDEDKITELDVSRPIRVAVLERLAVVMQEEQSLIISHEKAIDSIGDTKPETVLQALKINGLLIGAETLRFGPHHTLQEHFAARATLPLVLQELNASGIKQVCFSLARSDNQIGRMIKYLGLHAKILSRAQISWWFETFVQMAGMTENPNLLSQGIALYNPWLAWWCVQEGKEVDTRTREIIETKSVALINSPEVADRRRAAEALTKVYSERTFPLLGRLAWDPDDEVSSIAITSLNSQGEKGINLLIENTPLRPKYVLQLLRGAKTLENWAKETKITEAQFDAFCNQARTSVLSWMSNLQLTPKERLLAGDLAAIIGDTRPGVGLDSYGLPDIAWCAVEGGQVKIQDKSFTVSIFLIAKYPITHGQFQVFVDDPDGWGNPEWWNYLSSAAEWWKERSGPDPGHWPITNRPRERVAWYEAVAFCAWFSKRLAPDNFNIRDLSTWVIRLPTEAEWQLAASSDNQYPWGDTYQVGFANCDETDRETGPHYLQQTCAVGLYPQGAARCGALDICGNVWEYVITDYELSETEDWQTITEVTKRVVRGGSWYSSDDELRNYRDWVHPADKNAYDGFRICSSKLELLD